MSRIERLVTSAEGLPKEKLWTVMVNGVKINAHIVDLIGPKGLRVRYGRSPAGNYAQTVLEKPGGVTTAVVCEHSSAGVLVGILGQKRVLVYPDTPDDMLVETLPGGFAPKDKTAKQGAEQELAEEAGLVGDLLESVGSRTHMDRALVVYASDVYDEFFYIVVDESALVGPSPGALSSETWRYNAELNPNPSPDEQIVAGLEFVSAEALLKVGPVDVYTQLGIFKALYSLGRINCD